MTWTEWTPKPFSGWDSWRLWCLFVCPPSGFGMWIGMLLCALGPSLVLGGSLGVSSTLPSPLPCLKCGGLRSSKSRATLVPTLVVGGDLSLGISKAKENIGPNTSWCLAPCPGLCCPGAAGGAGRAAVLSLTPVPAQVCTPHGTASALLPSHEACEMSPLAGTTPVC